MTHIALKMADYFTYANYREWPETERWELIDGEAYAMSAPSRVHQKIVVEIARQIGNYLQNKPCENYVAPFDVRLPKADEADSQIDTVVQPDIVVVCDENKLDDKGCRGAPDWIIEVLSPSTAFMDMSTKLALYQQHGVKEYWLIHPSEYWVMIYTLNAGGEYGRPQVFNMEQPTAVGLFPDLLLEWAFLALPKTESEPAPQRGFIPMES
jgi:Uma2 family endonuclease